MMRCGAVLIPGMNFFTGTTDMVVRRELEPRTKVAGIAPGNDDAESRLGHTRQRINAPHRFLVEIDDLFRSLAVGNSRDIDGQDVARVEAGLRRLDREQRFEQHAGASEEYEGGGDLRHGKDAQAATSAAGDADSAAGQAGSLRGVGSWKMRDISKENSGDDGE